MKCASFHISFPMTIKIPHTHWLGAVQEALTLDCPKCVSLINTAVCLSATIEASSVRHVMSTPMSIFDMDGFWGEGPSSYTLCVCVGCVCQHSRPSYQTHQKFCHVDCGSAGWPCRTKFCTCRQYKNVDILILNRNFINSNKNSTDRTMTGSRIPIRLVYGGACVKVEEYLGGFK